MIHIANPLYDVVFKYLMEDKESSLLLLSKLLGMELLDITLLPQEHTLDTDLRKPRLTVYHLDFSAKVQVPDGTHREVLLEVQKAKFLTDVLRFRQYLGKEYASEQNVERVKGKGKGNKTRLVPLPIISVYILGYELPNVSSPVVKVNRQVLDLITGEVLGCREEFIEALTHDCFIIQASRLKQPYRNELEAVLSIFDQGMTDINRQMLKLDEERYPEKYRRLLRRLTRAVEQEEVRNRMDIEDRYLLDFEIQERDLLDMMEEVEKSKQQLAEKDQVLAEKDQVLAEKDQVLAQKDQVLAKKDQVLAEQAQVLAEKDQVLAEKDNVLAEQAQALAERERALEAAQQEKARLEALLANFGIKPS